MADAGAADRGALIKSLVSAMGEAYQRRLDADEQTKQRLGERLFPLVSAVEPQLAGKIVGMLLEMDNRELIRLLESPDSLNAKITEAMSVLKIHADTKVEVPVLDDHGAFDVD